MSQLSASLWTPTLGARCLLSSSWAIWRYIPSAAFSQVTRLLPCAVCLSLCSGLTIAMARTIRSAPSMRTLSPPKRWRSTPGKSRNRKVYWTRRMPRLRRCASKSSRCPPDTPPKRSSIRRNAPSSRRTSRNSRPAKSTSTWTSN